MVVKLEKLKESAVWYKSLNGKFTHFANAPILEEFYNVNANETLPKLGKDYLPSKATHDQGRSVQQIRMTLSGAQPYQDLLLFNDDDNKKKARKSRSHLPSSFKPFADPSVGSSDDSDDSDASTNESTEDSSKESDKSGRTQGPDDLDADLAVPAAQVAPANYYQRATCTQDPWYIGTVIICIILIASLMAVVGLLASSDEGRYATVFKQVRRNATEKPSYYRVRLST